MTLVSFVKGIISGVCMPNMKSPSLTVQKLLRNFKLKTDRQTDNKQTDRQADRTKQYAPSIDGGGGDNKRKCPLYLAYLPGQYFTGF